MTLKDKYKELTDAATVYRVANLQVREQDGVLYIDGESPAGTVKDAYGKYMKSLILISARAIW